MATPEEETIAAFEAEMNGDFFGMYDVARSVMDRLVLVRKNLVNSQSLVRRDLRQAYSHPSALHLRNKELSMVMLLLDEQTDNTTNAMLWNPATAVGRALCRMDDLLQTYPQRIPEIFHGYTPVSDHPNWAMPFASKELEIGDFGTNQEPMIMWALEQEAQNGPRYTEYKNLAAAFQRSGRTLQPPEA